MTEAEKFLENIKRTKTDYCKNHGLPNHRYYVLELMDIIGITLALNHAIGVQHETN